jgi:ectoine hydroxylase-related dioxygenase (phytanoyl-CoA dioxygenase family)
MRTSRSQARQDTSPLSAEDRVALDEAGFVVLRGVADARMVEAMREAWDRAMAAPAARERGNNEGPDGMERDPAFHACLEHPRVMAAVAHVLDGDVVLLSMRGREPRMGSGQQGFHVDDAAPVEPDRQRIANAFWMLDDMDEANGATRVLPGSHRLYRLPDKALADRESRHPRQLTLKARAGDVIVFSAHLWHAGSRNVSGARRRIAMAHFARREVIAARAQYEMAGEASG